MIIAIIIGIFALLNARYESKTQMMLIGIAILILLLILIAVLGRYYPTLLGCIGLGILMVIGLGILVGVGIILIGVGLVLLEVVAPKMTDQKKFEYIEVVLILLLGAVVLWLMFHFKNEFQLMLRAIDQTMKALIKL